MPVVSVVIATYNWSSVLRYSIPSVLWQTFQDFEVLVIGDACTDDSEQVVMSFNDPRVQWYNLAENSGSQSMPNNKGIELAKGTYIAYLGHDDLWHPTHLEVLVDAIEAAEADAAFTIAEMIPPDASEARGLTGLSPSGQYTYNMAVPPSSLLHRKDAVEVVGEWIDYRQLRRPVDIEFVARFWEHDKRVIPVTELTVFKFPSAKRRNSYVEKPSHEQADYARRIQHDPEVRYHELMDVIRSSEAVRTVFFAHYAPSEIPDYGEMVEQWREVRGLIAKPELTRTVAPIHQDLSLLQELNMLSDIAPFNGKWQLFKSQQIAEDGLFVGFGWHGLEHDEWGRSFRWVNNNAEIVVTKSTGTYQHLWMELAPGPGVDYKPFRLYWLDEDGQRVADVQVDHQQTVEIRVPITTSEGRVFKLYIEQGGLQIETDPRIMNFRVFRFGWIDLAGLEIRHQLVTARSERDHVLQNLADLQQLLVISRSERDDALQNLEELQEHFTKNQGALQSLQSELNHLQQQHIESADQLQQVKHDLHQANYDLQQVSDASTKRGKLIEQLDQFRMTSIAYWVHRVRASAKIRRWLHR